MRTTFTIYPLALFLAFLNIDMGVRGKTFGQVQESWSIATDAYSTNVFNLLGNNVVISGVFNFSPTILKSSAEGQEKWSASSNFPSIYLPPPSGLALDSAGNVFFSGRQVILPFWPSGFGFFIESRTTKLDARDGNQLWSSPYAGTSAVDSAGNVFVSGSSMTLKLAAKDGQLVWSAQLDGRLSRVDHKGDIIVGGNEGITKLAGRDGRQVWSVPINTHSLGLDALGDVYTHRGGFLGGSEIVKLASADGSELWSVPVPSFGQIAVDQMGFVCISSSGLPNGFTTKLAAKDGAQIWSSAIAGNSVAVDGAGNVYVSGVTTLEGSVITVKRAGKDGSEVWSVPFSAIPWSFSMSALKVDSAGDVYVLGWDYPANTFYGLKKYVQRGLEARIVRQVQNSEQQAGVVADWQADSTLT